MLGRRRPQFLPTRKARGAVEGLLRLCEKVPLFREVLRPQQEVEESDVPLTLVMPLHEKDFWIVPYALSHAKKNVRHPITEIVVVSAASERIEKWAREQGLRWIDEDTVLPLKREEVGERMPAHAGTRKNWIFQQLIKLSMDELVSTEAFLIIDADTLLLAPRVFKKGETIWMDYSHERNLLYLKGYRELLGLRASLFISYVCHHMFCEKRILKELKEKITEHTGERWDEAIIALADSSMWSEREKTTFPFNYFSEYETYGNFSLRFYDDVRTRYFRNHAAKEYSPQRMTPEEYVATLPGFFQWASFHSYHDYEGLEEVENPEMAKGVRDRESILFALLIIFPDK